jgi:hypothetical protein
MTDKGMKVRRELKIAAESSHLEIFLRNRCVLQGF